MYVCVCFHSTFYLIVDRNLSNNIIVTGCMPDNYLRVNAISVYMLHVIHA